jgi:serine/threonine protein kinase
MQSFSQYLTCRSMLAKKQGKGFSETETKEILRQVLAQLNTLHERRQSHGSISLDTIAYDQKRLMIVLLPSNGRNNPIYLAPEVVQTRQATPTADIYAVAVVMIVLLTGSPPEELKTATDMWNWEERCNISDRFIQILNIALSATRDFRYVNAGQMIRSLKPIIAIPEPKIDPTRINPAIASANANQLQNEGSQDLSQDDLSMPTVAEASQHLNPDLNPDSSDPIDVNRFNSIPAKKSPFVAFTHGSNSIGSTSIGSTKLDSTNVNINAKGEDAAKSQFNRLEITGKSQGDISQSDFCAFQLPFSNEDADDFSEGAVPKNNKASITKTIGAGGIASSPNGSLLSLKDNEESVESMPTSKFRLLLAAIFAGGIIIGGLLSVLILYRFIELSNNRNLQTISSDDLDKAIARVYDSKKAEENIDKLLTLAKYKYEYSGNLSEAETMLQSIPSDVLSRNKGDQLLVAWKEDQKKIVLLSNKQKLH